MKSTSLFPMRALCATLAIAWAFGAHAESTGTTVTTVTATTSTTTIQPVATTSTTSSSSSQAARISSQYASWAGSSANANSLVTGLRTGSPITLQSPAGTTIPAETTTFTPPTQNMGWGNVTKALSLAQADLAAAGITNPTPSQLQTALTGGDILVVNGTVTETAHMSGILTMRSQGMGWGEIAHRLDLKPGEVFRPASSGSQARIIKAESENHSLKEVRHAELETEHDHAQLVNGRSSTGNSRITTAAGGTVGREAHSGHHSDLEKTNEHSHFVNGRSATGGSRITTATGGAAGAINSRESHGHDYSSTHTSHATVSRVVTASGVPVATSYASYHDAGHGSTHGSEHWSSHVTTAAGGSISATGGHDGGHGSGMKHGKD